MKRMFMRTKIISTITKWWSSMNLYTRLMVFTTLSISLLMSSLTFWALTTVQDDSILTDTRFCKDLGMLFVSNIIDLIEINDTKKLFSVIEKIYLSTSSIRYILLFRVDGSLLFGLPLYSQDIQNVLQLHQDIFQLETQDFLYGTSVVEYSTIFHDHITDIIIPLIKDGKNLGSLNLGINPNPTLLTASRLTRDISIVIFVSIWFIFIIGATFNALTITKPIKELLRGVRNIAAGNFSQRIVLPFDGELEGLIISFNDMAERLESYEKNNVDKLISEKVKLETIISTIADGAILIDSELRFVFVNQIALKVFDWSYLDVIGKSIYSNFPVHVNEALIPILNSLVQSSYFDTSMSTKEEVYIDFDYESNKIFRFVLSTVIDPTSNLLTGIAITIQDVSREFKLNKVQSKFISNVSHELRTPLCNIGSFLETLLDYNASLSNLQKMQFLTIANNETKRLSALVNDILDLSRLEAQYQYELKPVSLKSILSSLIKTSQLIANNNNINLKLEVDPRIDLILAHESSLWQVLDNLLSNAIKFTGVSGEIILRSYLVHTDRCHDDIHYNITDIVEYVRIEVIDNGIGIDKVYHKNIFDQFIRIENSVHTLQGTGLGLSIVNNILKKCDSQIMIHSECFVGTSLWFDLLKFK
uniref:Uncharacterized sensor-like histidine kinase ycf26 n=1 Tax=Asparagopsis taxiformis TaxID=260499 RepID=A0A1C9CC61_9FLOR|nr:two component sensor kinase [Asparagopsis taxiformis]AOM65980.1 two component sensor kinase [Asparagopsis taxiformis]